MSFFEKLKEFFFSREPSNTVPKEDTNKESPITIKRNGSSIEVEINEKALLKSKRTKRNIQDDYYITQENEIGKLPIVDTKTGKVRRITGSMKPTEVVIHKYGSHIGMCEIDTDDVCMKSYSNLGETEYFDDLYAKDLAKLLKLGEIKIPFLAHLYTDFSYLNKTNAYYTNEGRVDFIFYVGKKEDVVQAMKEDLLTLNEKIKTEMEERRKEYPWEYNQS